MATLQKNTRIANRYGLNIRICDADNHELVYQTIDFANITSIDFKGDTTFARGGAERQKAIGFYNNIVGEFTLSTQILTDNLLCLMTGRLTDWDGKSPIRFCNRPLGAQHKFAIVADTVYRDADGNTHSELLTFHRVVPRIAYNRQYEGAGDVFAVDIIFDIMQGADGQVFTIGEANQHVKLIYMDEKGANKLYEENVAVGGSANDPVTDGDIEKPNKESTAQYSYEFSGWSLTPGGSASAGALTNIDANRVVYAAFTSKTRSYAVTFQNDDGTVLHTEQVKYGGNATYSTTPTSSYGSEYEFKGWKPSPTNIVGNITCAAQYKSPVNTLDGMTWAEIAEISAAGTAANYFDVGDCKAVALKGTVGVLDLDTTLYVFVLGINHGGGNGVTFGTFKTASDGGISVALTVAPEGYSYTADGTKNFNMNHWGSYNYGGWAGSDLRYDILGSTDVAPSGYGAAKTTSVVGYDATKTCATNPVNNTLMAALPADLRAVMKPMTIYTDNTGNGSNVEANVTATVDYLPLLAEYEIFGTRYYANGHEKNKQTQYAYFAAGNSKMKYRHSNTGSSVGWWERSADCNYASYFCYVDSGGYAGYSYAGDSCGLAPAFLV